MIQIICTLVLFLLILFPVGNYIYHISAGKKTWADPLFDRVDNVIFKSLRIDRSPMSWKQCICCWSTPVLSLPGI